MLKFTIVIEPETFSRLPEDMREKIIHALPRKIERERQRLEFKRMQLEFEENANQQWKSILNDGSLNY
jgi:sugar-specific transcriptional regulator TrmB